MGYYVFSFGYLIFIAVVCWLLCKDKNNKK